MRGGATLGGRPWFCRHVASPGLVRASFSLCYPASGYGVSICVERESGPKCLLGMPAALSQGMMQI